MEGGPWLVTRSTLPAVQCRPAEGAGAFTRAWTRIEIADLVVPVDPEKFGTGIEGTVDRYVAMTRATQRLVILTSP